MEINLQILTVTNNQPVFTKVRKDAFKNWNKLGHTWGWGKSKNCFVSTWGMGSLT